MINQDELMKIGLSGGEAKVYLALLYIGESTVGLIVKKSGIAYSNIYEVLQRLIEKGLVSFIIKEKTKHFQVINPNYLYKFVEKKEKRIEQEKAVLRKIMPSLVNIQKFIKERQEAEIFIGIKGVKTAYERLLENSKKNDNFLFFYIPEKEFTKEADVLYYQLMNFYKKLNVKIKGISNEEYRKSEFIIKARFIEMRYVNFPLPCNIDIFQDGTLFITWAYKPTAFLIYSNDISEKFRNYFESIWKMARK